MTTPTLPAPLRGPQTREFHVRADDEDGERTFSGVAVPYDVEIDLYGVRESIAPGAVTPADNVLVLYRHRDPIGRITSHRETPTGWEVTGVISDTPTGREAHTLMRDGVIDRMSIGFEPVTDEITRNDDGTVTVRRLEITVREVSLVPFPAYDGARVSDVRHAPTTPTIREDDTMPETATLDLPTEVRETLDDHTRQLQVLLARDHHADETVIETRSAGTLIRAAIAGDETALASLKRAQAARIQEERAYTGSTTADSVLLDAWVGDLTRLIEQPNRLGSIFATGALPTEGNFLEYAQLKSNTVSVDKQATEGADLPKGKVQIETKTAPVETYGGHVELTRQQIERSSIPILDHSLRALAIELGTYRAAALRSALATAVTREIAAGNTVNLPSIATATYKDWLNGVVDAAVKYETLGLAIDALVVDVTTFKKFNDFVGSDGRPLFVVSGTGANVVGSLDVKGIKGDLAAVPVVLDPLQVAPGAAFVNGDAIRHYVSGAVQLQDGNAINLSEAFSLYQYGAIAHEIPAAIIPVKRAA